MQSWPENEASHTLSSASVQQEQVVARLALATIVGIALYVVIDVITQLLPPHYNPISQAESNLAVGPYGYRSVYWFAKHQWNSRTPLSRPGFAVDATCGYSAYMA